MTYSDKVLLLKALINFSICLTLWLYPCGILAFIGAGIYLKLVERLVGSILSFSFDSYSCISVEVACLVIIIRILKWIAHHLHVSVICILAFWPKHEKLIINDCIEPLSLSLWVDLLRKWLCKHWQYKKEKEKG